jgi:hypothetical protein
LHLTLQMTAMRELVKRLSSTSILYASEASSSNKEGANNVSDSPNNGLVHNHATITLEGMIHSLTHNEGHMLSQTLLLPWDCKGGGGMPICHHR